VAAAVRARGHQAIVAPVMAVHMRTPAVDLAGVQAVLFTSANGVRAFAAMRPPPPDMVACAVGAATARAARDAGWARVDTAGGDVDALAAHVAATLTPDDGVLVHVSGAAAAGDLAAALAPHGFTVRRIVAYEVRPAPHLPEPARHALAAGAVDAVVLFSPRSARIFAELVGQAGLGSQAGAVTAFCLSQAVADALAGRLACAIVVAPAPRTDDLLALLSA